MDTLLLCYFSFDICVFLLLLFQRGVVGFLDVVMFMVLAF